VKQILASISIVCLISLTGCFGSSQLPGQTTLVESANAAVIQSAHGLSLSLSLDSTTYYTGNGISIIVNETNMLSKTNKVAITEKWPVSGLSVGPCGTYDYPFGVAIFQGDYTAANILSATPLDLYDPILRHSCPLILSDISSYVFQPSSDIADIFQNSESTAALTGEEMNSDVQPIIMGYWNGSTLTDFEPGMYTAVAGDEWGALVVLHFTVSE
jgi:hypothetical protein